ncbi:MAG: sugar ABC transporter permease [Deinococcus sp.]|nr:sugar ABC transporter permease [Deinococcus sp.]
MQKSPIKYVFLLPAVLWVLAFTIFPLIYSLRISFYNIRLGRNVSAIWVGLHNFARVFTDSRVQESVVVTLVLLVTTVTAQLVLGIALAVLFNRHLPGRSLLRTLMTTPLFATPVAVGLLFLTIYYEEGGFINSILPWKIPWISHPQWALVGVGLVEIWQWTPFCFLVFLAALQSLPDELYEAARLDTSSGWRVFRSLTLPMLQPVVILVLLLRLTEGLKVFDIPWGLTGGGPGTATQTYSMFTYRAGFRHFDFGYSSALGYVMLIAEMIVITFFFKRMRQVYE